MITKEVIERLGWKHISTATNGGSYGFIKVIDGKAYVLNYNGNNPLSKQADKIEIETVVGDNHHTLGMQQIS